MSKGNDGERDDRLKPYIPFMVALVSTLGATVGGNYLLFSEVGPEVVRPDPFTGTEGRALGASITTLKAEVANLKLQLGALPPGEMLYKVNVLERDLDILQRKFDTWIAHHNEKYIPAGYLQADIKRLEERIKVLEGVINKR